MGGGHYWDFKNENLKFALAVFAFEAAMIIFYAFGTIYDTTDVDPLYINSSVSGVAQSTVTRYYGFYQDVHVMIFIGFGFLMTFVRRNALTSVGMNFFVGALTIQWSILCINFLQALYLRDLDGPIPLNIVSLINGDFCAAAVLITYGAVLGKITPLQLVCVVFFEVIFYSIVQFIVFQIFQAVDMGGSMVIHAFGAYFGLALAFFISKLPHASAHKENTATYSGDTFAMIGTIFLWLFWPSFNGALALGVMQHRVIVNTLLSLCSCCVIAFAWSAMLRPHHKFSMVDIQNATLAGGVGVGSSADLIINPWGAFLIGLVAGTISTFGFVYLTPFLERNIGLCDTCGVHNLHGMPGLLGGIAGACAAATAPSPEIQETVGLVFLARRPVSEGGLNRSALEQGGFQIAALCVSVCMGLAGGTLTGLLIAFNPKETFGTKVKHYFDDEQFWEVAEGAPAPQDLENGTENGIHMERKD